MAGSDYIKCEKCGERLFYGVNLNWNNIAQIKSLCSKCAKKYTLKLKTIKSKIVHK